MPTVDIEAVPRNRTREAVDALVEAFLDYPETIHLLPDPSRRRRVLPRYFAGDCADSRRHDLLLGAEVGGRIVGAAAWLPPEGYPLPAIRQLAQLLHLLPAAPWGLAAAREASRAQRANRRAHPDEPHFFLRAIGVRPEHQRAGAGARLLAPVLDMADARGVGCYLTTAKADNVAYYERFGFTVAQAYHPTPSWPQVWSMWRNPR